MQICTRTILYKIRYKKENKIHCIPFTGFKDIKIPVNVQIPVDTEFIGTCTHNLLFRAKHTFGHLYKATTFHIMLNQRSLDYVNIIVQCNCYEGIPLSYFSTRVTYINS